MASSDTASRPRRRLSRKSGPAAQLTVVFPPELASRVALGASELVIGREGPGLVLAAPTVSKRHLTLRWDADAGHHVVTDDGSRHGTVVDGRPVGEPVALAHNSVVRVADVVMVYETLGAGPGRPPTEALPGLSWAMGRLREDVERSAKDAAPVLITGPTGAGKESVAGEVHRLSGRRGPLLAVNCAALAPQLAESQLFGHHRGAFTGADVAATGLFRAAQGGTLFLDEVGELSTELQPKLLRAIQQREVLPVGATAPVKVDVRVVAATNRDLSTEVEHGTFRRDLYARLALWELRVPALAERRADLVDWLGRLGQKWATERGAPVPALPLDAEAIDALLRAALPENLRTLDRLVHHLGQHTSPVGAEDLPAWLFAPGAAASPPGPDAPAAPTARRPSPTREELAAVLERLGSVRATAKHYERDRRQIYRWIEAYGLEWKDDEP